MVTTADGAGMAPRDGARVVTGDHPTPGARSLDAARAVGEHIEAVPPEHEVWYLLSGGTTSLIAAPVDEVTTPEVAEPPVLDPAEPDQTADVPETIQQWPPPWTARDSRWRFSGAICAGPWGCRWMGCCRLTGRIRR